MTTAPHRIDAPEIDEVDQLQRPWQVVVWNDPVNLMTYVVYVFRKLFGFPEEEATRLMLAVHHEGRAIVASGPREKSELDCYRLHHHGTMGDAGKGVSVPFRRRDGTIKIALSGQERAVLHTLPETLDNLGTSEVDPAVARLHPSAYPDDPTADAYFREMTEDDLAKARAVDRSRFTKTVTADSMSDDDAEVWLRVLGDARLALAARMGIERDDWEDDRSLAESRQGVMLHYLSYLQDALIQVLSATL